MGVLKPLKVVITNYPAGKTESFNAENNPEDPTALSRSITFGREIYIEQDDFMEHPPKKYFRLAPGIEVRLKHAYYIRPQEIIKDPATGKIMELRCTYDPDSRGGGTADGRRVQGTLHWVNAHDALEAEVRIYNHLFTVENPESALTGGSFLDYINPHSLEILHGCKLEPACRELPVGQSVQFLRNGYFCADPDSSPTRLVFNRTITLKDSWAKEQKKA
jgi:glutaminyl-tRNA synthetase